FSTPINVVGSSFSHPAALDDFSKMPNLEDIGIFDDAYDDRDEGAEADYNNLETVIPGHRQEEGVDYDEVFAPVARIEAIRWNFQRTYGEWNFSTPINVVGSSFSHPAALDDFSKMPNLEDTGIFDDAYDDRDEGAEADYNNLETVIPVGSIVDLLPASSLGEDTTSSLLEGTLELVFSTGNKMYS
nr:hypothetical protein [Tanacetum cinerariifolium]